ARLLQRAADVLDDEVDDARRPARGRRRGAGVVVVAAPRPAERHREVGVVVDQPRHHEAAGGVDLLVALQAGAHGDDGLAVDQDVGVELVGRGDDPATADEPCHRPKRTGRMERVWDYPRPPAVEPCTRRVRVEMAGATIADSTRALRVLETSHPPGIYIPKT